MFSTIFATIQGLFSKNKTPIVLIIFLILFAGGFYLVTRENSKLKIQLQYANQNIQASKDSIRIVQTNDKKEEEDKLAFVTTTVTELQKLNDSLAVAVKNTKGTVNTITKTTIQLVHDTTVLTVKSDFKDSSVRSDFTFDSTYSKGNYRAISGYTTYDLKTGLSKGIITQDNLGVSFTTGIKDLDKGTPTIFIRSDYPGFTATSIEGAVLSPKLFQPQKPARKFNIGFNISYSPFSYNLSTKKYGVLNQVTGGFGINYNLFK